MPRSVDIYTLSDPETGAVRYVGKSNQVNRRYLNHLDKAKRRGRSFRSTAWIKSLITRGLKPTLAVVETCDWDRWADRERYWVEHFKRLGCDLTNHNNGGYGPWEVSPDTRRKLSEATTRRNRARKGIPLSPEVRQKLSDIHRTRLATLTPQQRRQRADAMLTKRQRGYNKGWHHSPESKAAIGAANRISRKRRGHHLSLETKAKIGAAIAARAAEKKSDR